MSKRMKVLVSVLVAVVLLTVGSAAAVMADDGSTPTSNTTSTKGLLARVAEILDIPQENLVNAFKQARREMREEAFIRYLDKAVEKGLITQQEADEIKEWWEQKPEAFDRLFPRRFLSKALIGRHIFGAQRGWSEEALNQAVERGLITQEEADKIKERWESRLEARNRLFLRARISPVIRDRQMIAFPIGWHGMRLPKLAD